MRTAVLGCVLAVTMPLVGCAQAYTTRPGALKPATAEIAPGERTTTVAPAERTAAWQHAVSALLDQGYVPTVLNDTAGYISARRREDIADDALVGTMATVVISPEGVVRVEVTGTGVYTSEQAFLSAISDRQSLILQAVMAAAHPPVKGLAPGVTSTNSSGSPR